MKTLQQKKNDKIVSCISCRHYYITWDSKHPYGCRAFGMKSKKQPASVVLSSSQQNCLMFQPKEKSKK